MAFCAIAKFYVRMQIRMSRKEAILLQSKLGEYLINTQDSVRFYPLCANCVAKVETISDPPPKEEFLFVV